jgi:TonB family protein
MKRLASALMLTLVAACSSAPTPTAAPRPEPVTPPGQPSAVPPRADAPLTLDGYKLDVARRIARVSPETYDEAPPEVLKSIVVLEVTIDRNGSLDRVVVRRSNGIRSLENIALDSVRRAAPFEAPSLSARRRDGTVTFLESFLFRNDDRFRLLSLVR